LGVVDQSGEVANAIDAQQINVTPPLETTLIANWTYISADQSVFFTNKTTGGTGSNVYTYSIDNGTENVNYTISGNTITFHKAGEYLVTLHVSDASGEVNQSSNAIMVTPPLVINSFTNTSRIFVSADQPVSFSNVTNGGTGSDVWTYLVNGAPATPNYDNTFMFSSSGSDAVSYPGFLDSANVSVPSGSILVLNTSYNVVNDEDSGFKGYWAIDNYTKHIMVWQEPSGTFLAVVTYNGTFTTFAGALSPENGITEVTGATGRMEGGYVGTFQGTLNATSPSQSVYNFGGTESDILKGTYGNGQSGNANGFNWLGYFFGSTASSTFSYAQDGSAWGWNYAYCGQTWQNYGFGAYANKGNGDIVSGGCGLYNVSLTVTDKTGEFANTSNITVRVTPPLETSLIPNRTLISADQGVYFFNYTNGGTGSFTYSYSVSPNQNFTRDGNKFTFTHSGSYVVTLSVSDASGETNSSSSTITVNKTLEITSFTCSQGSSGLLQSITPDISVRPQCLISGDQPLTFSNTTSGG
ncbi:MAG: hypothetical protein M1356_04505, partial [Gammaproteobacteria bacterium]|nr:hypothetical protein [Gammaproteobacteria bacterium]